MIKEDYVSYEVAKLLKGKGFNEDCKAYYKYDKFCWVWNDGCSRNTDNPLYVSCPTQALAMKWLREVHGIMIITYVAHFDNLMENNSNSYFSEMFNLADELEQMGNTGYYATYEEAVEAALKYCLTELI